MMNASIDLYVCKASKKESFELNGWQPKLSKKVDLQKQALAFSQTHTNASPGERIHFFGKLPEQYLLRSISEDQHNVDVTRF